MFSCFNEESHPCFCPGLSDLRMRLDFCGSASRWQNGSGLCFRCKGGYALVGIGIPSLTHCQRLEHIDKLRP